MDYQTVMDFWFCELQPKQWWIKDAALDAQIRQRFAALHTAATAGELFHWRSAAAGRLAEVIVLDQFSRNMFRATAQAFATDSLALVLAQEAVAAGADQQLPAQQRVFFYMPYMHSESLRIHDEALPLFGQPGLENNLEFEHRHRAILERFGRYPHRNAILGRESTAAEAEFLTQPGSSF